MNLCGFLEYSPIIGPLGPGMLADLLDPGLAASALVFSRANGTIGAVALPGTGGGES